MMFSIIVPVYNIEKYLEQCVLSLVHQEYDDYEVILVDDGSKDECPKLCDQFAEKYDFVKVIHKENGGLVSARNIGVAVATGDYIGYVDGDDWVEGNILSKLAAYIEKTPVDIINFNYYNNVDGKDTPNVRCRFSGLYQKEKLCDEVYTSMLSAPKANFFEFGVVPTVWSKFYKAEILKANLCTNTRITFGEDVACSYFCFLQAQSVLFVDDYLYHYRRNRKSMTKAYNVKMFENCNELLTYLDDGLTTFEYGMQKQKDRYRKFVIFKCILNEGRSSGSIRDKAEKLNMQMQNYGWSEYLRKMDISSYPVVYKVFFGIAKRGWYSLLMMMCAVLLKIHR